MKMETERLYFRQAGLEDAAALFEYRSDPETAKHLSREPKTIAEVQEFISNSAKEINTPDTWYQLVITKKANGMVIGDIGLHFLKNENEVLEIGYTLHPMARGKGYAQEALASVISFAFLQLNKKEIIASVDPENTPSVKLLEKLGFTVKSHSIKSLFFKGQWVDDVVYTLAKSSFIKAG